MARKEDPTMSYLSTAFRDDESPDSAIARVMGMQTPENQRSSCGPAGLCEGCNRPIAGAAVADGPRRWHQQCYDGRATCHACRAPIVGEQLCALGRQWHPKFVQRDGAPFCSQQCAGSSAPARVVRTEGTRDPEAAELRRHLADVKAQVLAGLTCAACRGPIETPECVSLPDSDVVYHTRCFRCSRCSRALSEDESVAAQPSGLVCASCAARPDAGRACTGCGKPLAPGSSVVSVPAGSALSGDYHAQCFTCGVCRKQLGGGGPSGAFGCVGGRPACAACATARAETSKSSAGKVVTGSRPGMVVDPRSGRIRESGRPCPAAVAAAPGAFCAQCGGRVADGARFCCSCGAAVH
eukprot:m51a1_g4682 hypothetical protein (353) ;mRNA; r:167632-168782